MIAATCQRKLDDLQECESYICVTFFVHESETTVNVEGIYVKLSRRPTSEGSVWFLVLTRRLATGERVFHEIPTREICGIEIIQR